MNTQAEAQAEVAYEPLKVHVVASDVTPPAPAQKQKRYRTTFLTLHLVTGDLTKLILPASEERVIAYVQAITHDATISGRESDATAGSGMTLPSTNTQPWPIQESGPVYASGADGTDISITAVYCTLE